MNKLLTLSLLVASATASARSESAWHKSVMQEMQRMEKAFESMMERMDTFGKELDEAYAQETALNIDMSLEEKEETAAIVIKNIKTESLDANVNGDTDQLKIKTDQDTITLAVQEKFLSLTHEKEAKKEEKKSEKSATYTSFSAQHVGQLLSGRIDLSKADIQYDKKNQTVTILLPYIDKKKSGKKIPVTINNK